MQQGHLYVVSGDGGGLGKDAARVNKFQVVLLL